MISATPLQSSIHGRKHDLLVGAADLVLRPFVGSTVATSLGELSVDSGHKPERFLAYFLPAALRHYRQSPLGRYIAGVSPPGSFVDVGANLGMYSLVAREARLQTYLVEPEPRHAKFLARNEELFGHVIVAALSDQPGALPLYYDPNNPGATSLMAGSHSVRQAGTVPVMTFSDLVADGALGDAGRIRLVKVDVEGFEEKTIGGMTAFLEQGHRPDIWCEVRGDLSTRNGGSYRAVRSLLAPFGYTALDGMSETPRILDEAELPRRGVFDLLFVPAGRDRQPKASA